MGPTNGIAKVLAVLFTSVLATMTEAQEVSLPKTGADPVVLHVAQGPSDADMLKVFVQGAETPIAGRYRLGEGSVSFAPAFGFEPHQTYVARYVTEGRAARVTFQLPDAARTPNAAVTQVFPSGDTLPENTLRFYIHFSVPMRPQVAFDYIKLRDASGTVDAAAFMRFKQELWNEDRTRLTVLIDPGRIKREVATNVELGPALQAGQRYTLTVEAGWPSADGTSALPGFAKRFQVSDPLRTRPDTNFWSANAPCAGTRAPLTVAFDRPFDRHLLTQTLELATAAGEVIEGRADVEAAEQIWRFSPVRPWPSAELVLTADPTLEDVAGNNFQDLLDHVAGQDSDAARSALGIGTRDCTG